MLENVARTDVRLFMLRCNTKLIEGPFTSRQGPSSARWCGRLRGAGQVGECSKVDGF